MANNLGVTVGTDAIIKTTDIAGVHTTHHMIDSIAAGTTNIGDVDVLTLPALPAGTNNIGDVDIASIAAGDNNIGNVDVVSLPALAAGTNNIGDVDVLTLPALPAGTNNIGDVDVLSVIPGTTATSLGKVEDAAHTTGDVGVMSLAVRNDAGTALAGTTGDYIPLSTDSVGSLRVVGSGGGAAIQDGTNSAIEATVFDLTSSNAIATQLVDEDGVAASVLVTVAHGDTDAGDPLKVGYNTLAHGTNPTAVLAGQRTNAYANRHGIPWVIGGHPNIICRSNRILDSDGAFTNLTLIGTIGSSQKVVITQIWVKADKNNSGNVAVRIGFGASSIPASSLAGVAGIIFDEDLGPGEGHQIGTGSGIIAIGGDGEELRITNDDPIGGQITVGYSYYVIES